MSAGHHSLWEKKEKGGIALLIIDPQNDFHPGGSLAIPTADGDAHRTAKLILEKINDIDEIVVTLDTHQRVHIAHAIFWVDKTGKHPLSFTTISADDIRSGRWMASVAEYQSEASKYVDALENGGRFQLIIWPDHCVLGTPGHNVTKVIMDALDVWAKKRMRRVRWVLKGENSFTEMYSALRAEAPTDDPRTALNTDVIHFLKQHGSVWVCGQSLSHCVNFTVRDLIAHYDEGCDQVTIIRDASSPVPGFEREAAAFITDMDELHVRIRTVAQLIQESGSAPDAEAKRAKETP